MLLVYVDNSRVYNLFDKIKKEVGNMIDDMAHTCKNCPVLNFTQNYQEIF